MIAWITGLHGTYKLCYCDILLIQYVLIRKIEIMRKPLEKVSTAQTCTLSNFAALHNFTLVFLTIEYFSIFLKL